MQDIIMFLVFVTVGVMCDMVRLRSREGKVIITAYCLLTVCALVVVISMGSGVDMKSPAHILETALDSLIK